MRRQARSSQSGVALITTIIVVAVLAVVAVAFMQSTSTDRLSSRTTANYYRAQLAARAGLAEAMALIQQGTQGFTYVSGSEPEGDTYRTFLRRLSEDSGSWRFDGDKIYLDSGAGDGASILLTGTLAEPGLRRGAAWRTIPLEDPRPNESKQFAFWVDDAGGKQNLTWWGGGGARGLATNLADLRLALPSPNGVEAGPFPAAALTALADARSYAPTSFQLADLRFDSLTANMRLPSVSSLNLLAPGVPAGSLERYFFTMSSASGAATPSGGPKLNLAALRRHINNLNTDQGAESPRAALVTELLKAEPEGEENWGGGNLSWLASSGKYSEAEQKQIVANIIDYLDDDLIPTTDSAQNPTYIGVEMLKQADGKIRGHPFIAYLGFGLQFNITGGAVGRPPGSINSSRILCAMGLVNPWSEELSQQSLNSYRVQLRVRILGTVTGEGALPNIMDYFSTTGEDSVTFNNRIRGEGDQSQPDDTGWLGSIPANGGFLVAGQPNLNMRFTNTFLPGNARPPRQTFNNVQYEILDCRLFFQSTDGGPEALVTAARNLPIVDADPNTFTLPVPAGTFTQTYPTGQSDNELFLSTDPRAGYRAASFVASGTKYEADFVAPDGPVSVFGDVDRQSFDREQNVSDSFQGLTNAAITNHFRRLSRNGMESIGELGYIWTGKPWQTVNLTADNNASPADWNLLDYITAGRESGDVALSVLPVKAAATNASGTLTSSLLASGGFNINTRKPATLAAVMSNAPDITENFVTRVLATPSASQPSTYGEIAALAAAAPGAVSGGASTKFAREAAQRALANVAVNHSRVFTVYSAGEYRLGDSVSRAQLETDIFVGVDPGTSSTMIQVIDQRFR